MSVFKDLSGNKYERLTVVKRDYSKKRTYYFCDCDCGNKHISIRADALGKKTKSCGCLQKEVASEYCKNNYSQTNTYDLTGEYGIGYTSIDEEFYFDLEDYDKIKDYCWSIDSNGYVCTNSRGNYKQTAILLHRVITLENYNDARVVDHKNHKTHDNRKSNLRACKQNNNMANTIISTRNNSGITGVGWDKSRNKWASYIGYNGKLIHLGRFYDINDAIKARKEAEEKYFGEFSYDNSMR